MNEKSYILYVDLAIILDTVRTKWYYDQTAFFLEENTFLFFMGYVVKNGLSTTPDSFYMSFERVGSLRPLVAVLMSVCTTLFRTMSSFL